MTSCLSMLVRIAFATWRRAVSQLWCFRYADWYVSSRLFLAQYSDSLSTTIRSINFEIKGRFEMGRKFLNSAMFAFFGIGVISASFRLSGIYPLERDPLTISVIMGKMSSMHSFKR